MEFNESAETGSVENRLAAVRTLVEDLNSTGEGSYAHELMVDGRRWRVSVERLPG